MEAYRSEEQYTQESKIYTIYAKTRSWIATSLGIILTLVGVALMFFISSIEGTKEVKASRSDNIKILNIWREENDSVGFPEQKSSFIKYKNRDYYFVIEKKDETTGEIVDWNFYYDGGFEYVLEDYKFYVLTLIAVVVSTYISYVNYVSTVRSVTNTESFAKTLKHYQDQKNKPSVQQNTQYIPDFCEFKNKQVYEEKKREIIEDAGLNYKLYINGEISKKDMERWQKKKLRKIRKIKVKRIKSSDLLQEQGFSSRKVRILPMSQTEHQRSFLIKGGIQKLFSSVLGGFTIGFGVKLGNWQVGLVYGFTILAGYVTSVVIATDFTNSVLRNRFIAKADLLNEFDNIKERFYKVKKEDTVKPKEIENNATPDMLPIVLKKDVAKE